jgi:hypothetical protein
MARKQPPPNDSQERNTEIALFRYGLISAPLFDPLAEGQFEQALRAIAARAYRIPNSSRTRLNVSTLQRYLQLYNQGGDPIAWQFQHANTQWYGAGHFMALMSDPAPFGWLHLRTTKKGGMSGFLHLLQRVVSTARFLVSYPMAKARGFRLRRRLWFSVSTGVLVRAAPALHLGTGYLSQH